MSLEISIISNFWVNPIFRRYVRADLLSNWRWTVTFFVSFVKVNTANWIAYSSRISVCWFFSILHQTPIVSRPWSKNLKGSLFANLSTKILTENVGVIQGRENTEFCGKYRAVHQLPWFLSNLLLLSAGCSSWWLSSKNVYT